VEGQDIGRGVEDFFGEDLREYEWSWTVRSEDVPAVRELLGVAESEDLLREVAEVIRERGESAICAELKDAGFEIEFWSRVGG
jgi:hypothetical protein